MKIRIAVSLVVMLLAMTSCNNDDGDDSQSLPYQNWQELNNHLTSRDWSFGIEVDPVKSEYAEFWLIHTNEELSMDDEVLMTVNGETVLSEPSLYDESEVYLDITNSIIPASRELDVVFVYNGETVFDSSVIVPEHSSISAVHITTPDEPVNIAWNVSRDSQMQLVEFGAYDSLGWQNKNYLLPGSARSMNIPANTFNADGFYNWGLELFQLNVVDYHSSTIMASVLATNETDKVVRPFYEIKELLRKERIQKSIAVR